MRHWLHLIIGNFFRAFFSFRFLGSCFLVSAILMLTIASSMHQEQGIIEGLEIALSGSSGVILFILALIPLVPFTLSFSVEHQQKALLMWIIRSGVKPYAFYKLTLSILTAFFVTALGIVLVVVLLSIWFPLRTHGAGVEAYSVFIINRQYGYYLLFYITHIALGSVLFAVLAFWISTIFPNVYVTLSAPVVCYFVLHRLTSGSNIPLPFQAVYIFEAVYNAGTAWSSLLFKLIIVSVLSVPLAYASVRNMKRRVANV